MVTAFICSRVRPLPSIERFGAMLAGAIAGGVFAWRRKALALFALPAAIIWAYITAFAERRMGAGLPMSMIPLIREGPGGPFCRAGRNTV